MNKSKILYPVLLATLILSGCKEQKEENKTTVADSAAQSDAAANKAKKEAKANQIQEGEEEFDTSEIELNKVGLDTLVAEIDGTKITAKEVMEMVRTISPEMRKMPLEILFLALRDQLIDMKVLQAESQKHETELLKRPDVQEALTKAREQILVGAYMKDLSDKAITEDAIRAEYNKFISSIPADVEEAKVHQIIVKKKEEAQAILEDLEIGIDFFKLAREKSIDKRTAENNGEIPGYISILHQQALLPGQEIIFEKKNGQYTVPTGSYTRKPIETPAGFMILKVMERRPLKKPTLEEMKPAIEAQLKQQIIEKNLEALRKKVSIKRFHPNTGKPMESLSAQVDRLKDSLIKAIETEKAKTSNSQTSKNKTPSESAVKPIAANAALTADTEATDEVEEDDEDDMEPTETALSDVNEEEDIEDND